MTDIVSNRLTLAEGIAWAVARLPESSKGRKAARLGVSVVSLNRWIDGSSAPTEANLARLARLAGVEQDDIRSGGVDASSEAL